jgi:hypothetical protein
VPRQRSLPANPEIFGTTMAIHDQQQRLVLVAV